VISPYRCPEAEGFACSSLVSAAATAGPIWPTGTARKEPLYSRRLPATGRTLLPGRLVSGQQCRTSSASISHLKTPLKVDKGRVKLLPSGTLALIEGEC
jgi:hypothetical protein